MSRLLDGDTWFHIWLLRLLVGSLSPPDPSSRVPMFPSNLFIRRVPFFLMISFNYYGDPQKKERKMVLLGYLGSGASQGCPKPRTLSRVQQERCPATRKMEGQRFEPVDAGD